MRYSKIRLMVTPRPPSADGSVFITVTANGLQSSNGVKAVKAKTTSICSSPFLRMAKCWLDKPWKMSAEDLRTRTWNHRNSEVEIDLAFIAKLGTNRLSSAPIPRSVPLFHDPSRSLETTAHQAHA